MLIKKELFYLKISKGDIKSCSLVGIPTDELLDAYFNKKDLLTLFDKYDIKYTIGKFNNTDVAVYFPNGIKDDKLICLNEMCMITIEGKTTIKNIKNIEKLFKEVKEYYQVDLPPNIINKMVGLYSEPITFSEMLMLIPEKNQTVIAEKIGKSKQALSDIKSGKNNMTLQVLSSLMKKYPLLPWVEYIETAY